MNEPRFTAWSSASGARRRSSRTGEELRKARETLALRLDEARAAIRAVAPEATASDAADLRAHLDRFKAMVFNGAQSVKLPISGNRINKVSRRLCEAAERFESVSAPIRALAARLAEQFPDYPRAICERAAAALLVIDEWGETSPPAHPGENHSPELARNILDGLTREGKIRLGLFVCTPVDFTRLSGEQPEKYLLVDMHGSVLSRQVDRLRDLLRGLEGAEVGVELLAMIGDTDEEDYLWHGVSRPSRLDPAALDARRDELVRSVAAYVTERVISAQAAQVVRLSSIPASPRARDIYAAVIAEPRKYFDQRDLDAEIAIMKELWLPGSYYQGLEHPDDATLAKIVVHKFATYALQGVLLHERDPRLLLIQTERPPALRSKMLNAGRESLGLAPLTSLNFF
jgi:hypothetical protein